VHTLKQRSFLNYYLFNSSTRTTCTTNIDISQFIFQVHKHVCVCVCVYGEFILHQTSLVDSNLPTRLCATMLSISVSHVPHVDVYYLMSKKVRESLSTKVVMIGVRMQAISFFLLQWFEEIFFWLLAKVTSNKFIDAIL
jgi:hypothetical protein